MFVQLVISSPKSSLLLVMQITIKTRAELAINSFLCVCFFPPLRTHKALFAGSRPLAKSIEIHTDFLLGVVRGL